MPSSARPQSSTVAAPEEETPKTPLQVLLKERREARGLSAQAMSRAAGLNDSAYRLFELGKTIPSESSWEKLCRFLVPVPPEVEEWWQSKQAQSTLSADSFAIPDGASVLQKWLIEVRKAKRLSKVAMSVACGFGTSTYTHYEDGTYLPPDIRLRKIAAFVGVKIPQEVLDYIEEHRAIKKAAAVRQYKHANATPVSEWVHTHRVNAGMTQSQLEAELGWVRGHTKIIEQGVNLPSAKCFRQLQKKFGKAPKTVRDWLKKAALEAQFQGFQNDREDISPFARVIREHRRAKGLSGTALSRALGFGDQYIARLERGARSIPPKKVLHIAKFFGYDSVPDDWLTALDISEQVYRNRHEVKEAELPPLGREIRRIRNGLLLSQHDVCRALGWGLQKMTTIELGVVAVNDETLAQIAKVLKLDEVPQEWYELRKQSRQVPQPQGVHGLTDHLSPFGRFIRSARIELNLRQVDLSKLLGHSNTYIHEVEYGRATITTDEVHKILVKLGYPPTITKEIESMVDAAGQWRKFPGLAGNDLPPEGLEERIKRWHASRTIKAQADLENGKPWQVAERELGARLSWKERRRLAATAPFPIKAPRSSVTPFGLLLRKACTEACIFTAQLDHACGLSPKNHVFQDILTGKRAITRDQMEQILPLFGYEKVPADWDISFEATCNKRFDGLTFLGQAIRQRIKTCGLTQIGVTQKLNWTPTRLASVEYGAPVSDRELTELAVVLNFTDIPSEWLNLRENSRQVPQQSSLRRSRENSSQWGLIYHNGSERLNLSLSQITALMGVPSSDLSSQARGCKKAALPLAGKVLYCLGFPMETTRAILKTLNAHGNWPKQISAKKRSALLKKWYADNDLPELRTFSEVPLTAGEQKSCLDRIRQRIQEVQTIREFNQLPPFGADIYQRRSSLGLSADEFCRLTNLSAEQLNAIESGKTLVDTPLMWTLAQGLNLPRIPQEWPALLKASKQLSDYFSPFGLFLWDALKTRRIGHIKFVPSVGLNPTSFRRLLQGIIPLTPELLEKILTFLSLDKQTTIAIRNSVNPQGLLIDADGATVSDDRTEELLALWHEAVVLSVQIELKKTIEKAQPHLNKAEFGRWLKNKRETEAMSMDKLASVLRLSLAEYVAYESGQKAPDSGLRKVVRRIFGPFFPIKVKKA